MRTPLRMLSRLMLGGLFVVPLLMTSPQSALAQSKELKERTEIDNKYKWDLTAIYPSDAAWEADFKVVQNAIPTLKSYEGKISKSTDDLLAFIKLNSDIGQRVGNLIVYAGMGYDQDTRNQVYTGYRTRASDLASKVGEAASWFAPELVSISDATFAQWYTQKPELTTYRHFIDDHLRTRAHTLSPAEERLLALSSNLSDAPQNASTALAYTDIIFPTMKDDKGQDIQISEGRVQQLLQSPNKETRRSASSNLLNTYSQYKNTAAALMSGNVAGHLFYARGRNYNSALDAALDGENIDTTVYHNLIETVRQNIEPLHKYLRLRRQALGLDSIHQYDFLVPLITETNVKIPYEEAVKTVQTALVPLGPEYLAEMKKGFEDHWIDVYETKGKRTGGYSWGGYPHHPYILLNYNDTMNEMFTVAHEMGHAMNRWYSYRDQSFLYSENPIFVAEVASTFNEALLMDYLLKKETDPKKKLYLVNQYVDQILGTVIRQTMWADYELKMHEAVERGEPLTSENLCKMYRETVQSYYGTDLTWDDWYDYTWIRVPHFYYNFYVYKYATSFAASQALSQKVLNKEKGAREAYLHFLASGSSKYPLELLKDAGVDMSKPAPVQATMTKFGQLVDEMEKLLIQTQQIKAPAPKKN
jgi:oligoendopeptidase F